LHEILRQRYKYQHGLAELPADLVAFVSDVAGGVPLQIEEVIESLIEQKVIELVSEDMRAGGLRTLVVPPLSKLQSDQVFSIPSKIIAAAKRTYAQLSERHQLIVKLISPFEGGFSIAMVHGLLVEKVPSSIELTQSVLLIDMKDLVKLRVLEEVHAPTPFMREHDAAAKTGYIFLSQLLRCEVMKTMLHEDISMVKVHISELRTAASDHNKAAAAVNAMVSHRAPSRARVNWHRTSSGAVNWHHTSSAEIDSRADPSLLSGPSEPEAVPESPLLNPIPSLPTHARPLSTASAIPADTVSPSVHANAPTTTTAVRNAARSPLRPRAESPHKNIIKKIRRRLSIPIFGGHQQHHLTRSAQ